MKEYNVILKKDVDYDSFWDDMESDTDDGLLYIPNRRVEFTNERVASLRQCWYLLTDEEADLLRNDDRVLAVEIPPEKRDDLILELKARQQGDFTKTVSSEGSFLNWGMIRSNNLLNPYDTNNTIEADYTYTLTGEGVDVVIQDSGIQVDHPEFLDDTGVSRVQQINWFTESGVSGTQSVNHYRDFDGHGTHVAGTIAGVTYGWAKNAKIYSQKLAGLEGSGDGDSGISLTNAFDTIKLWHRNKPIDPTTGYKRPTVVNMSWGFAVGYNTVSEVTYRGVLYSDATTLNDAFHRENSYGIIFNSGLPSNNFLTNIRVPSVDVDVDELIDEGVIVCIAAGNFGNKIDLIGGTDYNNNFVSNGNTYYYHRGSSPYSVRAINVGNMDSVVGVIGNSSIDQKSISSETGPGVDIYAPGTNIMSACSNTNAFSAQPYYRNGSFTQVNISGTSMASPQVSGVCALLLQLNPTTSPNRIKNFIIQNSGNYIYSSLLNNDWSNRRSLYGGQSRVLYNKFNEDVSTTVRGGFVKFAGIGV
jgi:subtilisin family serine protease